MIGATNSEMKNALAANKELRCDERKAYFSDGQAPSITIDLRVEEPHQLIYLARLVAHLRHEENHFSHGYISITTWGVWGAPEAPGLYFRHDEFMESICCLLQSMLVGWDAYYVPTWASGGLDYFVAISHDSFVDIEVRMQEMYNKSIEILTDHDWIRPLMR
jgi:hypothetical protein